MRLFVAIPLPRDLALRASEILPTTLPALRRVKPESRYTIVDIVENATPEPRHIVLPVELIVRDSTRTLTNGQSETAGRARNRREELS